MFVDFHHIVEALIFSSDKPVTAAAIMEAYQTVTGDQPPEEEEIVRHIQALNQAYENNGRIFRIYEWGGGYQMATEPVVEPYLRAFYAEHGSRRLSRSLIETLAVISYRQPVTKTEIDYVRGVDAGYAVRKLMEMNFVAVVGRSETIGRPLLYGTTPYFLEQFGLGSLDELPRLREVEELLEEPAFQEQRQALLVSVASDKSNGQNETASREGDEAMEEGTDET
jgi:segregation and condensation protein B